MNDEIRFAKGMMFPWGSPGEDYCAQPNPQILQDYSRYVRILSGSVYLDPTKGTVLLPTCFPCPGPEVAGNEEAKVEGDPHVTEADGGHFDFQGVAGKTYNLFNDTGLVVNARFQKYQGNAQLTTIQSLGMSVSGLGGSSLVRINSADRSVTVDGRWIDPGRSVGLADGGTLSLSSNGNEVTVRTREGYLQTISVQGDGNDRYLNYKVRSSSEGVDTDYRMPGGLVGEGFDGDGVARNGRTGAGANGEGAIDGTPGDYEVPGGIFGFPKPQIIKNPMAHLLTVTDPASAELLGLPQGASFALIDPGEIQRQWNEALQNCVNSSLKQTALSQQTEDHQKMSDEKLSLLLQAALKSGNFDLAVVMLSGLEAKQSNQIAASLMGRIQELQEQRGQLAEQMGELSKNGNAQEATTKLNQLNTQAGDIGTEISLLQTFLQDAMATKKESLEFASQAVRSSHETSQAIIQNIGR